MAGYLEKDEFKDFLQKQAKVLPVPAKRGRGRPPGRWHTLRLGIKRREACR